MIKSLISRTSARADFYAGIFGTLIILVVLVYCAIQISTTRQWLQSHRAYIQDRDIRWEAAARSMGMQIEENTRHIQQIEGVTARP